jgi:hypothetical protein
MAARARRHSVSSSFAVPNPATAVASVYAVGSSAPCRLDCLLVQVAEAACVAVAVVAVVCPEVAVGVDAVLSYLDCDLDAVVEESRALLAVSGWVAKGESGAAGFSPGSADLFAADSVVLQAVLHVAVVPVDPASCPSGPALRPVGPVARGAARCQADRLQEATTALQI